MLTSKIQKIIAGVLILSQLAFWPVLVFAQTANPAGPAFPVPITDSGSLAANNSFNIAIKVPQGAYTACNTVLQTFEKVDKASQIGFSFSSIIGGGGALAQAYLDEVGAYSTYLDCLQGGPGGKPPGVLTLFNAVVTSNLYTDTIKQQTVDQVKAKIQTYEVKLKDSMARYNNASQSIWKAVMITLLINSTKVIADQLVTKLVNNYKIANIKAYTDSLATLAYDNQFIRDNFPGSQDQLMARAILQNPLFRTQIPPGLFVAADNALGFVPADLNANDPNFYAKMTSVGFAEANPYFLHGVYVAKADQARANSLSTAAAHITQGNGYKAPVNCAGSLAQQQSIDLQSKAAADQLANRKALYDNLTQAQKAGQPVNPSELARTKSDYEAALAAWNNVPFAVAGQNSVSNSAVGGGNNTEGKMAIVMCEAVASPAVLVNQGIDALFKAVGANISQYNSNNLPGFLSQMTGIATQIGSSMVLGGISGKGTSLVNEDRAIAQAVIATENAIVQTISNNAQANLEKGIDFEAVVNPGVANGFKLSWELVGNKITNASYVTVSGNGITGAAKNPVSGNFAIVSATGGDYVLTVYDAANKPIISATLTISPPSKQAYNYNPSAPSIAGAFTVRPLADVRGPAPEFHPRGE